MNLFNPYRTLRGRHCYCCLLSEQNGEALTAEITHSRSQSLGAHSAIPKHNVSGKWLGPQRFLQPQTQTMPRNRHFSTNSEKSFYCYVWVMSQNFFYLKQFYFRDVVALFASRNLLGPLDSNKETGRDFNGLGFWSFPL